MKSVRLVQIFRSVKKTNRTHSKGYVEDLSTQTGRKRCAKMAVLNLSVLPYVAILRKEAPIRIEEEECARHADGNEAGARHDHHLELGETFDCLSARVRQSE